MAHECTLCAERAWRPRERVPHHNRHSHTHKASTLMAHSVCVCFCIGFWSWRNGYIRIKCDIQAVPVGLLYVVVLFYFCCWWRCCCCCFISVNEYEEDFLQHFLSFFFRFRSSFERQPEMERAQIFLEYCLADSVSVCCDSVCVCITVRQCIDTKPLLCLVHIT